MPFQKLKFAAVAAAVIGALASVIVIEAALFIDRKGIDDPVGAFSVHGI